MAVIQNVHKVTNNIVLDHVIVSCTDKRGLISNEFMSSQFPKEGLLGFLAKVNPGIVFISTGNTYDLIKSNSNLNVVEMSEYTGYPEMKTGLVKSLHPKIHAGILGHIYTPDDRSFMEEHNIPSIDAVITNFYDLKSVISSDSHFESLRQAIDVGGPTMCHAARKAFVSTSLIIDYSQYFAFVDHIRENNGKVSLSYRFDLAKEASARYTELMSEVNSILQNTKYETLMNEYEIV